MEYLRCAVVLREFNRTEELAMDTTKEINSLSAQTLALEAIVTSLCCRLRDLSPVYDPPIRLAFEDATNLVEHMTIILGTKSSQNHVLHVLAAGKVVESLQTAIFGNRQ
jgi:hypothetical protein